MTERKRKTSLTLSVYQSISLLLPWFVNETANQAAGNNQANEPRPQMPDAIVRTRPEDVTGNPISGDHENARHFVRKFKQKRTYYWRDGCEHPPPDKKHKCVGGNQECHHVILASRVSKKHICDVQPNIFELCQTCMEADPVIKSALISQEIGPIKGLTHLHIATQSPHAVSANYIEYLFAKRVVKTNKINCMVRPGTFKYNGSTIWESICAYVAKGESALSHVIR